jgi:acetyl esterase/lipase
MIDQHWLQPRRMVGAMPLRSLSFLFLVLCTCAGFAQGQAEEPWLLWPAGAPGSPPTAPPEKVRVTPGGDHVVSGISQPSITPFLPAPDTATGVAVIIAPGGGHSEIWIDHEGYNAARSLQQHGIAAFVLKYRLAREPGSTYTVEGTEVGDMRRAIRLVRSRAVENKIDPARIGVMGFSAGGELAALVSTRFDEGVAGAVDPVDRQSSRVAFQALLYPAIPKDLALSAQTPPAFLVCGEKDRPDISRGLPKLYLALEDAGVSTELLVFAGIGHGFGIRPGNPAGVSNWPELFLDWLSAEGMLPSRTSSEVVAAPAK